MLYHCMANLMVYLLKVSNSRRVDRHLRYPGKLRSPRLGDLHVIAIQAGHRDLDAAAQVEFESKT